MQDLRSHIITTKLTFPPQKGKPKNFAPTMPLYFSEAFEIPKDFSRKVLCVRVWGDAPTDNTHEKNAALPRFLFFGIICWNCVPNLALRDF